MLQINKLKASIETGEIVFGLINSVAAPLLVEMMGYAGYDFVIIDMEHVSTNPETIENAVRAAEGAGLTPLIRVPNSADDVILRALDCGAQGVVVPHVRSRVEAEQIVTAGRYYPQGKRGISGGRTTGFGTLDLPSYFERANKEIMLVVMIEDQEGVNAIDEIASVTGIDMVLEGAIDLSQSYGVPGKHQDPRVQQAIQTIAQSCHQHGVPFCAIPRAANQLDDWIERGVNAFLVGDDRGVAFRALKGHLAEFKDTISPPLSRERKMA